MIEAAFHFGIACTYGSAAYEAVRIGHVRLACCYVVMAALAAGLAVCQGIGV